VKLPWMQAASCPIASHCQGCRHQVARSKTASWCYTLRGCRVAGCKVAVRKAARHRLHVSACKAARCKVAGRKAACSRLRTPRLQRARLQGTGCRLQGCSAASCSVSEAASCRLKAAVQSLASTPVRGVSMYIYMYIYIHIWLGPVLVPRFWPHTRAGFHTTLFASMQQSGGTWALQLAASDSVVGHCPAKPLDLSL
jgi:hypothetical protein